MYGRLCVPVGHAPAGTVPHHRPQENCPRGFPRAESVRPSRASSTSPTTCASFGCSTRHSRTSIACASCSGWPTAGRAWATPFIPPVTGIDPDAKEETHDRAHGRRQGAVLGAGVQDHDRPVRRSAHVLPRLLGHADLRLLGDQLHQGQDRAHRPPAEDARQQARGNQGSQRRRHRRRRRPEVGDHRRHAVRREEADHPRADGLPGAGHLARHRAEDQGRPGKARPGHGQADGRRPDLPRHAPTNRPARS